MWELTAEVQLNCTIALATSTMSLIFVFGSVYIYYFNTFFRLRLNNNFNSLIIGAMIFQAFATIEKCISCIISLNSHMEELRCNATGAIEHFFDSFSLILLVGFFYKLMALRFSPFQVLCRPRVSLEMQLFMERYGFFFVAFAYSVAAIIFSFQTLTLGRYGSYYKRHYGWCSLVSSDEGQLAVSLWAPSAIVVVMALASFLVLRFYYSNAGPSSGNLSFALHSAVYLRYGGIVLFLLATQLVSLITSGETIGAVRARTVISAILPLWPMLLSIVFLASERVHKAVLTSRRRPTILHQDSRGITTATVTKSTTEMNSPPMSTDLDSPMMMSDSVVALHTWAVLNGFTTQIQSLLVLEVQGKQYVTSRRLEQQDMFLRGHAPSSPKTISNPTNGEVPLISITAADNDETTKELSPPPLRQKKVIPNKLSLQQQEAVRKRTIGEERNVLCLSPTNLSFAASISTPKRVRRSSSNKSQNLLDGIPHPDEGGMVGDPDVDMNFDQIPRV